MTANGNYGKTADDIDKQQQAIITNKPLVDYLAAKFRNHKY
jgi:hypothetical protein